MKTKREQQAELEERLHDGFMRIGEAMQNGLEVSNWEKFWIELLREYERLEDVLAAMPLAQASMPGMPRREAAA